MLHEEGRRVRWKPSLVSGGYPLWVGAEVCLLRFRVHGLSALGLRRSWGFRLPQALEKHLRSEGQGAPKA